MTNQLTAKAFRGELTAEALLKRIKAERAREVSSQNQNTQSMQCVLIVSQ